MRITKLWAVQFTPEFGPHVWNVPADTAREAIQLVADTVEAQGRAFELQGVELVTRDVCVIERRQSVGMVLDETIERLLRPRQPVAVPPEETSPDGTPVIGSDELLKMYPNGTAGPIGPQDDPVTQAIAEEAEEESGHAD